MVSDGENLKRNLATIYSVGSDDEETIENRMAGEVNRMLGGLLITFASGISLLLFYAFVMNAFAYFVALIAFQRLNC